MLEKTRGIVLKVTDYGDTSLVVQLFTEHFGMQSYLVQGAKRPKASLPANKFQHLQLLDLVVQHKPSGGLQRIKELKLAPPLVSIPYDIEKSCVGLFVTEVLYKALRQIGPDEALFDFVFHAVCWLDSVDTMPANYHLYLLMRLTKYLGIQPAPRKIGDDYFDLKDGIFLGFEPHHPLFLAEPYTSLFTAIQESNLETLSQIRLKREQRQVLLNKLIEYYQLHVDGFGEIRSQAILEEILS